MRVMVTSVSDVVTTLLSDVVKTLPQRYYNVATTFRFLFSHRNVRELPKYLSIESSLWQARRSLVISCLCLLLVCDQDKVVKLDAKAAMKGLGREKKCLHHNTVDLFLDISTVPDR